MYDNPAGDTLLDWWPRHIVAMVTQIFSLMGSGTIVASFFILKNRRSPFHYEVLFLNIADMVWTSSHFINHLEAIIHNHEACTAMGMFTHLGIGWELMWLAVIAMHTALLLHSAERNQRYQPSKKLQIIVAIICWSFPILWWTIIGISVDAYTTALYFCWVRFTPQWKSLLFADIPIFLCFAVVASCYSWVIYRLLKYAADKKLREIGGGGFKREILRSVLYIVVFIIWMHPYLTMTILFITKKNVPRGMWIYFLFTVNSLGWMNFFAYGISERWFTDVRNALCGGGSGSTASSGSLGSSGSKESLSMSQNDTIGN